MKSKALFIISLLSLSVLNLFSQQLDQSFIAVKSTGVQEFLQTYPEYDGRGTLILIFDSGVDIGVDGLTKTTTGETKAIDVQDFSGEGDVNFYEAEVDEEDDTLFFQNEEYGFEVKASASKLLITESDYFIGAIREEHWKNSSSHTTDLNNNGKKNDEFIFIVFKPVDSDNWVVYVDTNGDGLLDDETPLKNFRINQESFQINTEYDEPKYTFEVNIFPEDRKVVFHYDAVAHGTHCAGIASGNKIGNDEFYGVAPGAYLGSMKIGSSVFSGGSTTTGSMKAAYDYADQLSRELNMPIIINMSYGIGSEIHGQSDMEKYLDQLVSANPNLYISLSAGNEGPGLSTIGLPSSSSSIFTTGATLAKEVGNDLYGSPIDQDIILHFSSRGGEVAKPDLVAPGAATSTVPYWTQGDRMWGTSMAAPYTAGVMSLLLSAMQVEYPDVKIPSLLLYKALRESAEELSGYCPVDQGGGMINVVNAYELLKKYIDSGEIEKFETYRISATAPSTPNGEAENLYIRNGTYLTGVERFEFNVRRNFFNKEDKFFRSFRIESDSDWLIPITQKTYIRNNQKASVAVSLDKSKMSEPGLYSGKITGYRNDASNFPEFNAFATIIIPYHFTFENNFKQKWSGKLAPGEVKRYFLNIPPAASSMKIKLWYDESDYSNTWYALHDPDGRDAGGISSVESEKDEISSEEIYYDLQAGVYELDVVGYYKAVDSVSYNISVEFNSIETVSGNNIDTTDNTIQVINNYNDVLRYDISGEILGYEKDYVISFDDDKIIELPFTINENESEKVFNLSLNQNDFNTFTDFSVNVYDSSGKSVATKAFGYKDLSVSFTNSSKETNEYTIQFVPAFVDDVKNINIFVNEQTFLNEPFKLDTKHEGSSSIILYPSIMESIDIQAEFRQPDSYLDEQPFGKIYFENERTETIEYELPIYINF